jgi:hypothetical protein
MNIYVQAFISLEYIPESRISGSHRNCGLNNLRKNQSVFQSGSTIS